MDKIIYLFQEIPEMSAVVFLAITGIGALSLLMERSERPHVPLREQLRGDEQDPGPPPARPHNALPAFGHQPTGPGPKNGPPHVRSENIAHD